MKLPTYLNLNKTRPRKSTIQKIVPLDFFSWNNVTISKHIESTVPYFYHYFLPVQSYKEVVLEETSANIKYILVSLPRSNRQSFLLSNLNKKTRQFLYLEGFHTLLKTTKIMNLHNIVHSNISKDSIVFIHERPYLQDFSQSFLSNGETPPWIFEKYQPHLTNRCPSWHLACYLQKNKLKNVTMNAIEFVLHEYIDHASKYKLNEDFWIRFYDVWYQNLQKFFKKSDVDLRRLCIEESKFWDIYSLSFLYLQHIDNLSDNIFIQKFIDFLKKNILFEDDIENRFTCIFQEI